MNIFDRKRSLICNLSDVPTEIEIKTQRQEKKT